MTFDILPYIAGLTMAGGAFGFLLIVTSGLRAEMRGQAEREREQRQQVINLLREIRDSIEHFRADITEEIAANEPPEEEQ